MARNRFDVDETLETPFNIKHLLRAGVYIKRHKQKMILSLVFSAISAACALVGPKKFYLIFRFTKCAIDGIFAPCPLDVGLMSAPVAINRMF